MALDTIATRLHGPHLGVCGYTALGIPDSDFLIDIQRPTHQLESDTNVACSKSQKVLQTT